MRTKLLNLSKTLLTCCMALSIWLEWTTACMLFFGEYPYPNPEDYKD